MRTPFIHPEVCPAHGDRPQRKTCRACNSIYVRAYLRRRRISHPEIALLERARARARRRDLPFTLRRKDVRVPLVCPVSKRTLELGAGRTARSPSLDRICPGLGYVPGNVRVVSDEMNRLKSDHSAAKLRDLARNGPPALRADYRMIARYVHREALLAEVRARIKGHDRISDEWGKVADFLVRVFKKIGP